MRTTIVCTLAASFSTAPILLWHFVRYRFLTICETRGRLSRSRWASRAWDFGVIHFVPIGTFLSLPAFLPQVDVARDPLVCVHSICIVFGLGTTHARNRHVRLGCGCLISLIRREPTEL